MPGNDGGTAREEGRPYEHFLESLLEAEVFARDASGARQRIRHAAFPAHKTLEDFDVTAQPGAEQPLILHLAQLTRITEHTNVCGLGPPGTGKTHLAIAWRSRHARTGTALRSRPPGNGSTALKAPSTATHSTTNSRSAPAPRGSTW
ncbi:ATP-binding protein [Solirubrobacter taibaiensis]|nr:ATP-binding protein [Solirubrobacter taibaiensis]